MRPSFPGSFAPAPTAWSDPSTPQQQWRTHEPGGQPFLKPAPSKDNSNAVSGLVNQLWPHAFTLTGFALFGAPVIFGIHLSRDASVKFWIGRCGLITAAIPVLLVVCHLIHLKIGRPNQVAVIFSTVVPTTILLFVANMHLQSMHVIGNQLSSRDCINYAHKLDVERAWGAAAVLYHECLVRTASENKVRFEEGMQIFRLHECEEYHALPDKYAKYRDTWEYLRALEEDQQCSGWCAESAPLWTFKSVTDSCSSVAGTLLKVKIASQATRMLAYSILTLVLSVVGVIFIGGHVRKATGEHSW